MSTLQVLVGHPKRQRMSCMAKFFGTLTDFSTVTTDMAVVTGTWPTAKSKASALVLQHLEAGSRYSSLDGSQNVWSPLLGSPLRSVPEAN